MRVTVYYERNGREAEATIEPSRKRGFDGPEVDITLREDERITFNAAELAHAVLACLRLQQEAERKP